MSHRQSGGWQKIYGGKDFWTGVPWVQSGRDGKRAGLISYRVPCGLQEAITPGLVYICYIYVRLLFVFLLFISGVVGLVCRTIAKWLAGKTRLQNVLQVEGRVREKARSLNVVPTGSYMRRAQLLESAIQYNTTELLQTKFGNRRWQFKSRKSIL